MWFRAVTIMQTVQSSISMTNSVGLLAEWLTPSFSVQPMPATTGSSRALCLTQLKILPMWARECTMPCICKVVSTRCNWKVQFECSQWCIQFSETYFVSQCCTTFIFGVASKNSTICIQNQIVWWYDVLFCMAFFLLLSGFQQSRHDKDLFHLIWNCGCIVVVSVIGHSNCVTLISKCFNFFQMYKISGCHCI